MPQKIRQRKQERMEEGEMTGKMYGKKEMAEHRAEMTKSLQQKGKPLTKAESAKGEADYMKLKAEDARLNKPTSTRRVVAEFMMKKPKYGKKLVEKAMSMRAAKGVQSEKYRK